MRFTELKHRRMEGRKGEREEGRRGGRKRKERSKRSVCWYVFQFFQTHSCLIVLTEFYFMEVTE
jgi:hypothetical protein